MSDYIFEIKRVVESALADMEQGHKTKKLPNTPASNTQFITRWIATSIKQQRFDKQVVPDLLRWQKRARSQGVNAHLYQEFQRLEQFYTKHFPNGESAKMVMDSDIEQLLDNMESLDWDTCTEHEINGKTQLLTEGKGSIVLCSFECEHNFQPTPEGESEPLIKPMRVFVRGNHAQFITTAEKLGLLVYKKSDYKSEIKYHGMYLIYPKNRGESLPEIPINFDL